VPERANPAAYEPARDNAELLAVEIAQINNIERHGSQARAFCAQRRYTRAVKETQIYRTSDTE
jgi:hypothetical protein